VRIGIGEDSYVSDRDLDTVVLEVRIGHGVVAVVDTILRPAQVDEARHLLARVRDGLHTGALSPSVGSLEPLADSIL
jgi:hypothetical protein